MNMGSSKECPILITGASSGIGKACAQYLANKGFFVFAGARNNKDLDELGQIQNVSPVKLDVTNQGDIDNAFEVVKSQGQGLFGIINNAGITNGGPLIDVTPEELFQVFDVNVMGIHRITRTFSPLIIESHGRVIMMSSGSGKLANPFSGPYAMSKFGLEGYSDSLRREMQLVNVKIILVEPGPVKTAMQDKWNALFEAFKSRPFLNKELNDIACNLISSIQKNPGNGGLPAETVAKVVHDALTNPKPKVRYRVVTKKNLMLIRIARMLSDKKLDQIAYKTLKKFNPSS